MLRECSLDVLIPVIPRVVAGMLGVVMIQTDFIHQRVKLTVVLEQFVLDTAVERDDRLGGSPLDKTTGMELDACVIDCAGFDQRRIQVMVDVERRRVRPDRCEPLGIFRPIRIAP